MSSRKKLKMVALNAEGDRGESRGSQTGERGFARGAREAGPGGASRCQAAQKFDARTSLRCSVKPSLTGAGEIGALLRREGAVQLQLTAWRRGVKQAPWRHWVPARSQGGSSPKQKRVAALEARNARLSANWRQARLIIEVQKNCACCWAAHARDTPAPPGASPERSRRASCRRCRCAGRWRAIGRARRRGYRRPETAACRARGLGARRHWRLGAERITILELLDSPRFADIARPTRLGAPAR